MELKPFKLRLGLEPMCQDLNLAETQFETLIQMAKIQTQPKPTVFQLRSHTYL